MEVYEESVETVEKSVDAVGKSFDTVLSQFGISAGSFTFTKILPAIIMLVICLIAIKIILKVIDKFLDKSKLDKSLHIFIRSSIKFVLLFIMILLVAASIGINVTSLLAVFSVMGLAVSLAVQGTLSNLAGGIMVLVSKPFKVGDYVQAGDAIGVVKQIGLVHTQVLTDDFKLVFVPNGDISAARITNYTFEDKRRVDLKITASYDAPIETVYKALKEAADSVPSLYKEPEPFVRVLNYLDSSIEYTVRAWTGTSDYWQGYFGLLEEVKRSFDKYGVEMTYNHINVHMMDK